MTRGRFRRTPSRNRCSLRDSSSAKAVLAIHREALRVALPHYAQFFLGAELKDTLLALHRAAAANGESLQWPAARTAILDNFEGQPLAELLERLVAETRKDKSTVRAWVRRRHVLHLDLVAALEHVTRKGKRKGMNDDWERTAVHYAVRQCMPQERGVLQVPEKAAALRAWRMADLLRAALGLDLGSLAVFRRRNLPLGGWFVIWFSVPRFWGGGAAGRR